MLNFHQIFPEHRFLIGGFSAYLKMINKKSSYTHLFTDVPMQDMLSHFPDLKLGMGQSFDALLESDNHNYFIYFRDHLSSYTDLSSLANEQFFFNLETFFYDLNQDCFYDFYNQRKSKDLKAMTGRVSIDSFLEALTFSCIFGCPLKDTQFKADGTGSHYFFRMMTEELFQKNKTYEGFFLFNQYGILNYFMPEISALENIYQDKDYHPEGDGLAHTLECLKYLKSKNKVLGWSVILHDIGKAVSESSQKRKFDNHAQLGSIIAEKVLSRMGYEAEFIKKVTYLVKNHMLPMFIPHMTYQEKDRLLSEPLLKELFQLFKIDILGSHRDMLYYQKIKSSFLKEESHA